MWQSYCSSLLCLRRATLLPNGQSFDAIGLPGFQFIQDQVEYDTRTHHSNQDVFDRIQKDDLKQAATIMAAFLYNTAMQTRNCRAREWLSRSIERIGLYEQ
jgi:hypothetical protein